jgi:hypothetical protein
MAGRDSMDFGPDRHLQWCIGEFKYTSDRKDLRAIAAQGGKLSLILYTGIFLLIGLPTLWLWSIYYLVTGIRRKTLAPPVAVLIGFLLFNITYLTAVANFLSSFENNRYRFQFDAFFVILFGVALEQLRRTADPRVRLMGLYLVSATYAAITSLTILKGWSHAAR